MRQLLPELVQWLAPRMAPSDPTGWGARLRVTFVYVEEAHAEDEWPIGNRFRTDRDSLAWSPPLNQSTGPAERLQRAAEFIRGRLLRAHRAEWMRFVADSQHLPFQKTFGAWPTGFYLVRHPDKQDEGRPTLQFALEPTKCGLFLLEPLQAALQTLLG